jgi:predicted nuclease of predicted toxin-antitoxin system
MKVLLDECLPRKLKNRFAAHDCQTVPEASLAGKKNGELLSIAERQGFEIFLTMDKGLEYQQNLTGRQIAVSILRAKSNRLVDLAPLVDECLRLMRSIKPGHGAIIDGIVQPH